MLYSLAVIYVLIVKTLIMLVLVIIVLMIVIPKLLIMLDLQAWYNRYKQQKKCKKRKIKNYCLFSHKMSKKK